MAAASRIALDPILHERAVFLLFVIAVALCAHLAGFWAGLATAVLSVAAAVALQMLAPAGVGLHDSVQVGLFLLTAVPISLSAAEARAEIDLRKPDVIVSDIGMPGEDGLSFIRALRGHPAHRDIPAIALTAYTTATDQAEAIKAGYREHVPKPVPPYRLARVIVTALQRPS